MSLSDEARKQIDTLVHSQDVLLFMKGSPEAPQCGFSAQVVQILDRLIPEYAHFDVLADPEIREAIKEYSEWPTIPQLYVRGEFVGGCDIIREMYETGEIRGVLGVEAASDGPAAVSVSVSDGAAELLREALSRAGDAFLHLEIDARFRAQLGFGPRQEGEVSVDANGVTLLLDPETAARADGVTIDVVDTPEGRRLALDNPNAPRD